MDAFSVTGGAQIGWMKASWPLVKLTVTQDSLTIAAAVIGTYAFTPDEIAVLEPQRSLFANGIRIVHTRADCPKYVFFMALGKPDDLIQKIRDAGFVPKAPPPPADQKHAFPLPVIAVVAIAAFVLLVLVPTVLSLASFVR